MKYKLVWPKRAEKNGILKAGDISDLSDYTPEQREELVRQGQYVVVEESTSEDKKKAVIKNG
jgi:hypothetical protein